jgi:hypothetical protein
MATIVGDFGNQTLVGIDGETNLIYGDPLAQGGNFEGGDDTLIGGANSNNTLIGDTDTMVGPGTGGDDTLIGGIGGTNILIGDAESAGGGIPSGGADRLVSADNTADNMWGDFQNTGPGQPTGGVDTFVFAPNNGNDIIHDYQQGFDNPIELDGFFKNTHIPSQAADHAGNHVLETFADLNIEVVGTDSVIHFDANNSVTVLGVTGLTANDFHFVV